MKETWILKNKAGDPDVYKGKYGLSDLLGKILANRDIVTDEQIDKFLSPKLSDMPSYNSFKDIKLAVNIIKKAIDNGEHIRIVGDYDVDGVVSTYLLNEAFENLGAFVSYVIPDRIADGYGINMSIIEDAIKDGIDLIVTCDNGIAAKDQIAYAKEKGLTVVITDHHDVPDELPPADAIVNPKQADCEYPNKNICGAVVAAKVCEALYASYNFGEFIKNHLDVLALATVCDVMDLVDENRIIVKYGLEDINAKKNIGLAAVAEVQNLSEKKIVAYHLGFSIGPCINATGRLETAGLGVDLLKATDVKEAQYIAKKLKELNEKRKAMTETSRDAAIKQIEQSSLINDGIIVIHLPACHESLAGIIAGRLREKYNRPAIVLTDSSGDPDVLKGSGRSVDEYNMFEGLNEVKELFIKFGGHPKAAGMSLLKSNLQILRESLNEKAKIDLVNDETKFYIDVSMGMSSLSLPLVKELEKLEPTGNGNKKPVFADRGVIINRIERFGADSQYLKISVTDSRGNSCQIKAFSNAEEFLEAFEAAYGEKAVSECFKGNGNSKVTFVYKPDINEYRGNYSVQFMLDKFQFPSSMNDKVAPKENKLGTCYIVGGVDSKFEIKKAEGDLVIACDRGLEVLKANGVVPDLLIGDMDSISKNELDCIPDNVCVKTYPVRKDFTDTAIAVKTAISKQFKKIELYGAMGGERNDHSFANLSVLADCAINDVQCLIKQEDYVYTAISNRAIKLKSKPGETFSVFAYGGVAKGVSIRGAEYDISEEVLDPFVSLGVSNAFKLDNVTINVAEGCLIIMGKFSVIE